MELKTKIIWIFWIIIYLLNIIGYTRSPICYSNKKRIGITYNSIYYALTIIILIIQIFFAKCISSRHTVRIH